MLSTNLKQDIITQRVTKIVSNLMEEEPLFKEDLNVSEMIKHLVDLFDKNLPFEEFETISDESLKKRCYGIMSLHLLVKIGQNFTPEQMSTFESSIKRK